MTDTPVTLEEELGQAVTAGLAPKADPPAPPATIGPKLAAALVAFQAEMEPISRSRTVTVQTKTGGRYTFAYAPHDVIAAAMRPVLAKHKLGLIQPLIGHAVRTIIFHESGEQYAADFPLDLRGNESPQEMGSKVTYVRRYALSIVGLVTEEDDDANHATGNTITKQKDKPKPKAEPATPTGDASVEQLDQLRGLMTTLGGHWTEASVVKGAALKFRPTIKTLADLTADEAAQIIQAAQTELAS